MIILIHTSVKLVTLPVIVYFCVENDFNPHEREARDPAYCVPYPLAVFILIHTSVKLVT